MLKIKDNVDLNILIEKYGFKPRYDVDTGEIIELYRINGHYGGEEGKKRMQSLNYINAEIADIYQLGKKLKEGDGNDD